MAKADDGTVSTDVLLQIAQILVLRLPVGPSILILKLFEFIYIL